MKKSFTVSAYEINNFYTVEREHAEELAALEVRTQKLTEARSESVQHIKSLTKELAAFFSPGARSVTA